jgi:N-acetylmuramoyl-L-alanine amidase
MEIKQKLIPSTNTKARPKIAMSPKYITVHTTGNTGRGANALAHANLQYRGNVRTASWHAGTRSGNLQSIGIEICVNSDGNFTKTKENAVWLIRYLMNKHNIPISRVVPHKHWSGKQCPREILPYWDSFIQQIKSGGATAVSSGNRSLKLTNPYMSGDDVKKIQEIIGVTADAYMVHLP